VCSDIEGIEWIRLKEVHFYWGGAEGEVEVRKAKDVFAAYVKRNATFPRARIIKAVGYVDGMSLYEYARGKAVVASDPWGLRSNSACGAEDGCRTRMPVTIPSSCPIATMPVADVGRGRRGPPPPLEFIGCPGNTTPPWADGLGITWHLDLVQEACRGKCKKITIKCISTCDAASSSGCTIEIGPPCNPGRNRRNYFYHEIEHVYQYCVSGDIANCDDRLCRELDAYLSAGQCGRNAPPGNAGSCCDRACDSVQNDSWCFLSKARCIARCTTLWNAGTCKSYPYW
jgi:hypothetical protein